MSNQSRGTYFEHRVMDILRDAGYCVVRSAGSHGAADVVAVKPGVVLLVQAKVRLSLLGSREWTELYELAAKAGAVPVVAHRPTARTTAFHRLTGPRALRQLAAGALEEFVP